MQNTPPQEIRWQDGARQKRARWRSEAGLPPPERVVLGDERLNAERILELARAGQATLWRGDYQNARKVLEAMTRLVDRAPRAAGTVRPTSPAEAFAAHRRQQGERAALLASLLVPVSADYRIPLRRGQDVAAACQEVWGAGEADCVVSLRGLLALVSAHEWRKKGVPVPAVEGRIHPHFGVFSPVRGEYVDLFARAPLPSPCRLAFDIGTGSGILAAILARRGVPRVVATDLEPRALACAGENFQRLGLAGQIELQQVDLFPAGQADLVVCNPPWLPAQPSSPVENAVYDPDSRMLRAYLAGLPAHLAPGGEGWLIISDLAEHLGLRRPGELGEWIAAAGLRVLERHNTRPTHPKAQDRSDPLHAARAAEVTSLWRLGKA